MDVTKLSLFKALTAKMTWLNDRQRVLAQNVANADTPGYVARDVKVQDFDGILRELRSAPGQRGVSIAKTDARHLSGGGGSGSLAGGEYTLDTRRGEGPEVSPSGNAVVLEEEMMKVAKTAADYELMANLYQRHLAMFKLAIGKPGQR